MHRQREQLAVDDPGRAETVDPHAPHLGPERGLHGHAHLAAHGQRVEHDLILNVYRRQYIATGAQEPRFVEVSRSLVMPEQFERSAGALARILAHAGD